MPRQERDQETGLGSPSRFALGVVLLLAGLLAPSALGQFRSEGALKSMQLLTPQLGWASSGQRVFWTTSEGREWKDITPPGTRGAIDGVFFVDASSGWVLRSMISLRDTPIRNRYPSSWAKPWC